MKSININIEEFHPSIRLAVLNEFERLEAAYPLFGEKVTVYVNDRIVACDCGQCVGESMGDAIARTVASVQRNRFDIYFSPRYFGLNGDAKTIGEGTIDPDWHVSGRSDSEARLKATIMHEYGHVAMAVYEKIFKFDDIAVAEDPTKAVPDRPVLDQFRKMIMTSADIFDVHQSMQLMLNMQVSYDLSQPNRLVSGYAYQSPREFFAETFTAIDYGDDKQKSLETTQMMRDMLKLVYGPEGAAEMKSHKTVH